MPYMSLFIDLGFYSLHTLFQDPSIVRSFIALDEFILFTPFESGLMVFILSCLPDFAISQFYTVMVTVQATHAQTSYIIRVYYHWSPHITRCDLVTCSEFVHSSVIHIHTNTRFICNLYYKIHLYSVSIKLLNVTVTVSMLCVRTIVF